MNRLRNIGLVAHINAGKTTTTERILFHGGSTRIVGDVDRGNTVTDYLIQERDRGITITSAAVSYHWNKHRINLIDTPGHVDFTAEVERSLSVIDGVVTILDSSAGVEAQTITVWNQARKYKLPNIIFLNKYDKPLANYKSCINDLKAAFETIPCLIQLPFKSKESKNMSLLDIIKRNHITWVDPESDYGTKFISRSISEDGNLKELVDTVEEQREILINLLTDFDDDLSNHVVDCDKITEVKSDQLEAALRRVTLNCRVAPVLMGSSFKYIGVQQLMDSIIKYLPNPAEREGHIRYHLNFERKDMISTSRSNINDNKNTNVICGFIFKIIHDSRLGPLSFMKICNGSLKKQQRLRNISTNHEEQVKRIYRAFADEMNEITESVHRNDIVAVSGLAKSKTGDILIDPNIRLKSTSIIDIDHHEKENGFDGLELLNDGDNPTRNLYPFTLLTENILVPKIRQIEPVYHCSIESRKISESLKLEHALACLSREDPSFKYEIDQHGITTIRGMGKLHLDIIRDRIESEYKIEPLLGPLQISYRETINGSATEELQINRIINGVTNKLSIKLYVSSAEPNSGPWNAKKLRLDTGPDADPSLITLRRDHRKAIEQGLESALAHGPSFGYPIIGCDIWLMQFHANGRCGLPIISSTTSQCLMNALKRCSPVLLEPISKLEVIAPREFNSVILGDLSQRRAHILDTIPKDKNAMLTKALVPLSTLSDYSEFLRIKTSGRATFFMEIQNYSPMSESDKMRHRKQL